MQLSHSALLAAATAAVAATYFSISYGHGAEAKSWSRQRAALRIGDQLTLQNFADLNVAQICHVKPRQFGGIRGLESTRGLEEGDIILSVARQQSMSILHFSASDAAPGLVRHWAHEEDADMFLEVSALLYEAVVKGQGSRWLPYFQSLPSEYHLPVNYSDSRLQQLLLHLPELHRLVAKRSAAMHTFFPMVRQLLLSLPGGRAALRAWSEAELWAAFCWAYGSARTRSISIELPHTHPLARWAPEVGALVPMLDLANHAIALEATADLQVTEASFQLVARRRLEAGEQVTFAYVEEDPPSCAHRWLLEYGFVPADHRRERACMAWAATPAALRQALSAATGSLSGSGWDAAAEEAAVQRFDAGGGLSVALNAVGEGVGQLVEELKGAVGGQEGVAVGVARALVAGRLQELEGVVAGLDGQAGEWLQRFGGGSELVGVLKGAVEALEAALEVLKE